MVDLPDPNRTPRSTDETVEAPARPSGGASTPTKPYIDYLIERPGTKVGRYKLLGQLGEGGFGVVFKAEQEVPVRRLVAMKIIKMGMDTRDVVQRFEAERQALAMMDHPHIAKVFDAGATELGRPYFVMELVEGIPITSFCDQEKFTVSDRLQLFMDVCGAVQHAHQKGVIHRDLKPNNILVARRDGQASPKVIDFGIAKATEQKLTDRTMETRHGQFMGTPAYMSPEQAAMSGLDVDTRSDIYSLGVVLYELLTGALPFDMKTTRGTSVDDLRRIIAEVDPVKPSTRLGSAGPTLSGLAAQRGVEPKRLSSMLKGDLDWIVMKALEKDRARRYESVNGLRMDVERYLRGEAVFAAPPSASYRLHKFVRRNKGVVTAGAAVAAALMMGVVGFAWQASIAREQRDFALEAQRAEAEERAIAAEQRDRARIEAAKSTKTTEFITTIFSGINPYTAQGMDTSLIQKMLADSETRISAELADQPEVEAAIRGTLGRAYTSLGQYETARTQLDRALELLRASAGETDRQTFRIQSAQVNLLDRLGKSYETEELCRSTLEAMRKSLGENDSETVAMMSQLGMAQSRIGKTREAERWLLAALTKETKELGEDHPRTLRTSIRLAELMLLQSRWPEAEKLARHVVERRIALLGPDNVEVFEALGTVAGALRGQGKYAEAEQLDRGTLERMKQVLGAENSQTLNIQNNLAFTMHMLERFDEAEALYRDTLEKRRRVLGEEHLLTLSSLASLGQFLQELGRLDEAEPMVVQAYELRRKTLGEAHKETLFSMYRLATLHKARREFDQAIKLFEHIVSVHRNNVNETDPQLGMAIYNLAATLQDAGKHELAEPLFREVVMLHEKSKRPDEAFVAAAQNGIGRCLSEKKEYAEADRAYIAGLEMRRRLYPTPTRDLAYSLDNYGSSLLDRGDYAAAEPLLRENLEILRGVLPDTAWQLGSAMSNFGAALSGLGRFEDAEPLLLEGYEKIARNKEPKPNIEPEVRRWIQKHYTDWDRLNPSTGKQEALRQWDANHPESP